MIYIESDKILSKVVAEGSDIVIISKGSEVYWKDPFVIENPTNQPATITFERVSTGLAPTADFYYSIGKKPGEYKHYVNNSSGTTYSSFTIPAHQNMFIYSTKMTCWGTGENNRNTWKTGFRNLDFSGNINALLKHNTLGEYSFGYLFYGSDIEVAPNLPATTLARACYSSMFRGCTNLIEAPNLPATTLTSSCYSGMFEGCTSLTTAPVLRATTLAYGCYWGMFEGCTSLTDAPILPAFLQLAPNCYREMFENCTSLVNVQSDLPAEILAADCYNSMFRGCSSLIDPPSLPATTLANYCYSYMFYGCTSLTTAPELPATTLANGCYSYMFSGCSNLNYIKALFTTDITNNTDYTYSWVYGVAATGTFVKNADATWNRTGTSGVPSGWTIEIDFSSQYLTFEALEDNSTLSWKHSGSITRTISYSLDDGATWNTVTSSTDGNTIATVNRGSKILIKGNNNSYSSGLGKYTNFATTGTWNVYGNIMSLIYNDNFIGTTSLPTTYTFYSLFAATTIVDASNLILPATTLTDLCYYYMFTNCTSLTTPPKLPATTLVGSCYRYMFRGCTALTVAPELPATTLQSGCYYGMFQSCSNLRYIKAMFTTDITSDDTYTSNWVSGVAATGTFVKNANATWNKTGTSGIPYNWTIISE